MNNAPIGVFFDSGLGGLTAVRELKNSYCLTKILFISEIRDEYLTAHAQTPP